MNLSYISDTFANGMISLSWIVVNLYIIAVEFRFLLNWFLNINPFYEPFLSLWVWTNPIFCFGRSFYPKVFSWELAPIINFQMLYFIQEKLGSLLQNLNNGLPPDLELEMTTDPKLVTVTESYSIPDWVTKMICWVQKFLLEIKECLYSFWDSRPKTDFLEKSSEMLIVYLRKFVEIFTTFLDNFEKFVSQDQSEHIPNFLRKFSEIIIVYLRKFVETFTTFLDKLDNQPQGLDWGLVDPVIEEQLTGQVYIDENSFSLTINFDAYPSFERLFGPLFESDTLEKVHNYLIDLDVSTLAGIDILFQLNSHIVDNFLL